MKHVELNNEVMKNANGFYQLEKDREAVSEFMREVKEHSVKFASPLARMEWLITNGFYEDFFERYPKDQVKSLIEIAYEYKFKFQS